MAEISLVRDGIVAQCLVRTNRVMDMPHPDEPGVRIVGLVYVEAEVQMIEALRAMQAIIAAYKLLTFHRPKGEA